MFGPRLLAQIVFSKDVNFATHPGLYGLFSGQRAAMAEMYHLADGDKPRLSAIGLDKRNQGKPCFGSFCSSAQVHAVEKRTTNSTMRGSSAALSIFKCSAGLTLGHCQGGAP